MRSGITCVIIVCGGILLVTPDCAFAHADHKGGHEWPAAANLYRLADGGRTAAAGGHTDAVRAMASQLKNAADALVKGEIPKTLRNPLLIKMSVEEIESLASRLSEPDRLSDAELKSAVTTLAGSIHGLMDEAGIALPSDPLIGPHDGVLAGIVNGSKQQVGYIELKLHSDKGDLEAWLLKDTASEAFDLPLDTELKATFPDLESRKVTLRVRNRSRNEDEDGKSNIRRDRTNYFIFPGDTGVDAGWLQGDAFESKVTVEFSVDGQRYTAPVFDLKPHADHGHGHAH